MPRYIDTTTSNRELALKLARDGFKVFPCHSTGPSAKRPLTPHGFKDATDDLAQVRKWWAKWPGAAPGLPTGEANGLSVIDLDLKGGKDGIAAARARGIDPDAAEYVVRTPSGGLHLLFEDAAGVTNQTGKDGFDVRGEGGYIIAPGARIDGGTYEVERGGDLWTARILGLPAFPAAAMRPRAEPLDGPQAAPGGADVAELRAALACIPNDGPHDDWNRILMALHHATGGSEHGFALALGWSAGYPGFDPKEVRGKWRSYGKRDGDPQVTAATIFAEARRHGWQGIGADDFDNLPEDDGPTIADLLDMSPETESKAGPDESPLTFLSPADCATTNPRPYIVKGLIGERDVACIVGAPGVGKSVLAPALAYAVAQGRDFHGRRSKPGSVMYVAAEDLHGMRGRVAALRDEHGDADRFALVAGVTDLLSEDVKGKGSRHFRALRKAVRDRRPSLIVIDTLAMAFPGLEENSAEGMGRVVAVARALTKWGAAVVLIHHDSKDGHQGLPRGHSLLNGALDLSIHLTKADGGIVRGRLTKNRNGPCDVDLAFRVRGAEIGTDEDGDTITAAVCEPLDAGAADDAPRLKPTERAALDSLVEAADDLGTISEAEWRVAAAADARITTAEKPDSRRRVVAEALRGLARKGRVRVEDGVIHLGQHCGGFDFDDTPEGDGDV